MQFIEYEKCSTCQKAKCFLKEHNLSFDERSIVNEVPSYDELKKWVLKYQIEIKKLFNTSGLKYRELELKDKLDKMSDVEKLKLLSSDGMLIKRPLLITDSSILIGFKKEEYQKLVDLYKN